MAKYFLLTIVVFLFGLLLMPLSALAAWNTVVFTEDTNVVLGNGTTLVISSGGKVASMTVYSTYVSFGMEAGSNVIVTSNNRYTLTNTLNAAVECEPTYSRVSLVSSATQTVTVTPGDVCGSAAPSGGGGAAPAADTTAPVISGIGATPSDTTAIITWTTNESSLSWVVYGTSTAYGLEKKTTTYITSHSVTLTGLTPETTYHYQVKSKDSSGNIGTYTDKTFTTLATGEEAVSEEEKEEEEEEVTIPKITFEKPIAEMTVEEIKVKIIEIMEAISQFKALLAEIEEKVYEGIPAGFTFKKNLSSGETSDEVKYLQIILKQEVGPPTYPEDVPATGWFGPITKASVIAFQEKYASEILAPWELTQGTGFVGQTTRAKLNELFGVE